jgi:putative aldouronate transport system permease protein
MSVAAKKRGRLRELWLYFLQNQWMYYLLIPGTIFLIVFAYIPIYGVTLAFKDYSVKGGILGSPWIGLANFRRIFDDADFWNVVKNTLIISFYRLAICFPAAPIFAILLNELRHARVKRVVQTVTYLPYFLSWVVVYGMFYRLFSFDGVINTIFVNNGGEAIGFLSSAQSFRTILVLTDLWKNVGWSSIIYLAAIAGIDEQLFEAAIIDGANRFQRIRHIVVPGIMSAMIMILILSLGNIMNAGFEQIFVFYNPLVYSTGDILDTYVFRIGLQSGRFDLATAVGLFKSALGLGLLISANALSRKVNGYGLY